MVEVIASVVLGLVFLVAGGSKIAAGPAWLAQAVQLGAPRAVALAVPWWELVVGALLVVQIATQAAAAAALVTLVAFTALILGNLLRGRRPPCACFGAWSASPIGWRHVARNAVFAVIGVVALVAG